ncbi:MAG: hypothetical protein QUS11_09040 [Candidatus Fermentibacter sp.]|nr:hypothetical protein [Candidatus Fermentibacter sp.]
MLDMTIDLLRSGPPGRVLRQFEIESALGGTPARRYGIVNRALARGELVRLRRGLYVLPGIGGEVAGSSLVAANAIIHGSYVSCESALSFHGLIPERVTVLLSACQGRGSIFTNPLGEFRYYRIPARAGWFMEGVSSEETGGGRALVASPLRALADLAYTRRIEGPVRSFLVDSLRIDPDDLYSIEPSAVASMKKAFRSGAVRRFLDGLLELVREVA